MSRRNQRTISAPDGCCGCIPDAASLDEARELRSERLTRGPEHIAPGPVVRTSTDGSDENG
jgi:hypothetical protein